ncbi:hypothetical protein EW026_g4028 [Hermanssonia centrifuga]|uniref:Membrane-associated proteins in eicosanoid and glutathione metabolism n=1 Tax=Hermanssonia centrifuga TaxID=98765 RepID=A0A4S4KN19_9APHY|nr:hypothetical protein EW026_g4028 [Hermanssonia centrifuga]
MSIIVLPQAFAYPAAAVVSTFWLTAYQMINVSIARKAAKIVYPQMYAEKAQAEASKEAFKFNCAQRAHQNTLEWLPQIIASTLIVGLKYPIPAAALCGLWTASRFLYTFGYTSGGPGKRSLLGNTAINAIVQLGFILGGSTYTVYQLLA